MEIGEDRTTEQKANAAYLLSGGPHLSTCHQVTWNSQVAGWRCAPIVDLLPLLCDCNRAIFLLIHLKPKVLLSCPLDNEYTYECGCTVVSTKLAHPRFQQCVYISCEWRDQIKHVFNDFDTIMLINYSISCSPWMLHLILGDSMSIWREKECLKRKNMHIFRTYLHINLTLL
jgi:hypothetical protein